MDIKIVKIFAQKHCIGPFSSLKKYFCPVKLETEKLKCLKIFIKMSENALTLVLQWAKNQNH